MPRNLESYLDRGPDEAESDHEDQRSDDPDVIHDEQGQENQSDNDDNNEGDEDDFAVNNEEAIEASFTFDPPLYIQRYEAVWNELTKEKWVRAMNKIVEFGCAECKFVRRHLKKLPFGTEVLAIDLDESVLKSGIHFTEPIFDDFLNPRKNTTLDLYLMKGNVAQCDQRLNSTVDAVVAIELIEHLESESLSELPANIFGHIQPNLAIFTTPNMEFNVLFPNFEGPFRHWDHKFEWSRSEFSQWALEILRMYPEYDVTFSGIGAGPPGTESSHGYCSQMAVFVKRSFLHSANNGEFMIGDFAATKQKIMSDVNDLDSCSYMTLAHHSFVHKKDDRTREQRLVDEISYYSRNSAFWSDEWRYEGLECKVDFEFLMTFHKVMDIGFEVNEAMEILESRGFNFCRNDGAICLIVPPNDEFDQEQSEEEHEPDEDLEGISQDVSGHIEDECWD